MGETYDMPEKEEGCWWGNLKERDNLIGLNIDRRIILTWILKKSYADVGLLSSVQVVASCGNCDLHSISVNAFQGLWSMVLLNACV